MLDTGFHQAAGLNSFTPQAQLRVLAVASQERASSGLETLWQICAATCSAWDTRWRCWTAQRWKPMNPPASAICCKPPGTMG